MATLALLDAPPFGVTDSLPWLSGSSRFPATRVSVLERLRSLEPEVRSAAFGDLVTGYWKPVYKYLRLKWRQDEHDAADTTQGFLAAAFEKSYFEGFDPARARFRTFLRVCLDRFVMNQQAAQRAERRGGGAGTVPLDFPGVEGEVARLSSDQPADADAFFRHELVRELFTRCVADVRDECERGGRRTAFRVFERYDLEQPDGVTYADLAREFAIPATQVTNYLAAVRRMFRGRVLEQLHALCGSDEEYRAEARELLGLDVA